MCGSPHSINKQTAPHGNEVFFVKMSPAFCEYIRSSNISSTSKG